MLIKIIFFLSALRVTSKTKLVLLDEKIQKSQNEMRWRIKIERRENFDFA